MGFALELVRRRLDANLYGSLPHCVIHGDLHPGNVRFRGSQVAAVYDFDYLGLQARIRDVSDSLIFFAAHRSAPLNADDIRSLTQPFEPDLHRAARLMQSYQRVVPLTNAEWEALPLLFRSRWVQMRLRGSRKAPEQEKLTFVTERFDEVTRWLDQHETTFFRELRVRSGPA